MKTQRYGKIGRRATVVLLTVLLLTAVLPVPAATAAPGYYAGKISVVDEPENFSDENVIYYVGEEKTAALKITWVEDGHTGKALKLSGNGEFLRLGYTAARPREFTFSGWINWQGGAPGQRLFTIAGRENRYLSLSPYMQDGNMTAGGGFLNGIYLGYRYDNNRVDMFNPASDIVSYALPCHEWHHLAVVVDGRTIRLYIDGVRWFEQSVMTTMAELNGASVDIGSGEWGDPTLNALLDDVTLYNTAMSDDRILELAGRSAGDGAVYIPTQPAVVEEETAPTTTEAADETEPEEEAQTVRVHIPAWGIGLVVGIVVVYVLLSVILNIMKRKRGS